MLWPLVVRDMVIEGERWEALDVITLEEIVPKSSMPCGGGYSKLTATLIVTMHSTAILIES